MLLIKKHFWILSKQMYWSRFAAHFGFKRKVSWKTIQQIVLIIYCYDVCLTGGTDQHCQTL